VSNPKIDEIGFWSEVKLEIVRDYASAYSKILSKQSSISRYLYIDAFAGAGFHVSKRSGEFVPGSPLNALNIEPRFSEYHFIDLNPARVAGLQELSDVSNNVVVHHGDCNRLLLEKILPKCHYSDFARALCLLDPYALSVDWQVLETAGRMKSVEIFYNFMMMDANMNVFWRSPERVSTEQRARMTAVWGDESWRDAAYKKEQKSLLDEGGFFEEKASNQRIAQAFKDRLRNVAGFRYVPDPIPMCNSSGAVVYYLFFASPNATGHDIVEQIFKKHAGRAANG
jgi:three-Cys-motif partner protein